MHTPEKVTAHHQEHFGRLTGAAMTAMAAFSYHGERRGWIHILPAESLRDAGNSMAHPILGYAGAYVGALLGANRLKSFPRIMKAAAVATVLNFTVEYAQTRLSPRSPLNEFWAPQNQFETMKDWVFALSGTALYLWQTRSRAGDQPEIQAPLQPQVEVQEQPTAEEHYRPFDWQTDAPEIAGDIPMVATSTPEIITDASEAL